MKTVCVRILCSVDFNTICCPAQRKRARAILKKTAEKCIPAEQLAYYTHSNVALQTFGGPSNNAGFAQYCLKRWKTAAK